jgi:3-phenylpropionate/cinnamic acid dioxygenase small subunit
MQEKRSRSQFQLTLVARVIASARRLAIASAVCGAVACRPAPAATPTAASGVDSEARAVESVVVRVAHFIDARRWTELAALFADEVETDYTSLFGGHVQKQPSSELVLGGWQKLLAPLERTQHLLGPIDVVTRDDRATAECHVRAYHRSRRGAEGDEWMVAGHYVFELAKVGGTWKIQKLTLNAYYQTGNTKLLQEAAGSK